MDVKKTGKDVEYIDCTYTPEVVCPYCGYEYTFSHELGDKGETVCEECNKRFTFEADYDVTYCTYKIEEKGE